MLQAILLPFLVLGGYIFAGAAGGFLEDAWEAFLGPFLITYWIGFGFTMAWDTVTESMRSEGMNSTAIAWVGILGAAILLMMLDGPKTLIHDPWLFGAAIAPGLRLTVPWLEKRRQAGASDDA